MPAKRRALIIDDEKQIRRLLRFTLENADFQVDEAETAHDGLLRAAQGRPDVILLDLGLPDMGGLETLERLREWSRTPVLILSVRDDPEEKVAALDAGADDYVTKPFDTAELLARLRAMQRRSLAETGGPVLEFGPLRVDCVARQVQVRGQHVQLTPTEYALVRVLAQHAGRTVTHRQLLRSVWGEKAETQAQYLRVYITHLRRKLGASAATAVLIRTEPGIGYRLQIDES